MKPNNPLRFFLVLVTTLLGACSNSPYRHAHFTPDPIAAVTAIRSAGARFDSSVQVHPLRDASVEGLMNQVRKQESHSQYAQALTTVRKALKITPKAPDLLQYEAELLIENGHWRQAAAIARQSYDLGPKVGGLCARNIATLAQVDIALGNDAAAIARHKEIKHCSVPARVRM